MNNYVKTAELLVQSRHVMALTGAGISVESGIPDFRSRDGLWSRYDPVEFGYIESFRANPEKVWKMLLEMDRLRTGAQPNTGHMALAELEKRGILREIVTQNVDSLHQKAGSHNVIEFHGHARSLRCDRCHERFPRENISLKDIPPRCGCGYALRPEFVFFGEEIPRDALKQAMDAAQECDFMMIVGTSASVAPASHLPRVATNRGAFLLEINPMETELSNHTIDLRISQTAGKALSCIVAALNEMGH